MAKADHEYGIGERTDGTIDTFPLSELPRRLAEFRALSAEKTGTDDLGKATGQQPPSLFESFLSRHPISDKLRRSIHAEIVLLHQAFCDRHKERLDAERIKQISPDQKVE